MTRGCKIEDLKREPSTDERGNREGSWREEARTRGSCRSQYLVAFGAASGMRRGPSHLAGGHAGLPQTGRHLDSGWVIVSYFLHDLISRA
jgi:hypothetical protein